ncbi:P-loop containing nucleoside triphosphate hydrolase protein [Flagelloscypha sp. PMI_526]|nr:P-loop containing nucleoside triphosphate hydrolase protein [Flagelloscypha sp. PMI_526]
MSDRLVECPICSAQVEEAKINQHLDNGCPAESIAAGPSTRAGTQQTPSKPNKGLAPIFKSSQTPFLTRRDVSLGQKRALPSSDSVVADSRPLKRVHLEAAMPLAERLRPKSFEEYIGQTDVTLLVQGLTHDPSIILWGPPGCGKTTLARLIASRNNGIFKELSATIVGINDVRAVFEEAKRTLTLTGRRTTLFMDEIHRFNKSQQDVFLPYVEHGHIQLIGATTENPSFKLTAALISRCRVIVLHQLSPEDIETIVINALYKSVQHPALDALPNSQEEPATPSSSQTILASQSSLKGSNEVPDAYPHITPHILKFVSNLARGDARIALSLTELLIGAPKSISEKEMKNQLKNLVSTSFTTEDHYDMISALHKSIRAGEGSAALYWLARMLTSGEDPMFICRRLTVCASEDIGLANDRALLLAVATMQACERIGMPECRINLAHLVSYLSESPKSTRSYEAYAAAEAAAKEDASLPVPLQVRNAPTGLMKDLEYGKDYRYNPAFSHPVHNRYLPEKFENDVYLKTEVEYRAERTWDEEALSEWEQKRNGGQPWQGRSS